MEIETDASLLGWGARLGGQTTGGMWSMMEREAHINLLELLGGNVYSEGSGRECERRPHQTMDGQPFSSLVHNHMGGTRSQNLTWYT